MTSLSLRPHPQMNPVIKTRALLLLSRALADPAASRACILEGSEVARSAGLRFLETFALLRLDDGAESKRVEELRALLKSDDRELAMMLGNGDS